MDTEHTTFTIHSSGTPLTEASLERAVKTLQRLQAEFPMPTLRTATGMDVVPRGVAVPSVTFLYLKTAMEQKKASVPDLFSRWGIEVYLDDTLGVGEWEIVANDGTRHKPESRSPFSPN